MRIKNTLSLVMFLFLAAGLAGCTFLAIASVGAVGGYAITSDTIQGEYDIRFADVWKESLKTCDALGYVKVKDQANGTIDAEVDQAHVRVQVERLTPEATRLKVKARKGIFPRRATAEKVFLQVVQQLM